MQLILMRRDLGPHSKGDVVEVRATSTSFAMTQNFVMVEVPELTMGGWQQYTGDWRRVLDFEVVVHNPTLDGYRLRLFSETANAGNGLITKAEVETFIDDWSGTVVSFDTNEVVFDIGIYNALVSAAFFEIPFTGVLFSEVSYDEPTGVHRIQADYNALGNNPTYVEDWIMRRGMTVLSHAAKVIVYETTRTVARNVFQEALKEAADKVVAKRRYYVGNAVVNAIVAAGGILTTDEVTLLTYLKDKAVD